MGVPGIQTNWTPLKIVNGLNPNVKNTRPEVKVWKKIHKMRLEHSLKWAGLFLSGTCAVNLIDYQLFETLGAFADESQELQEVTLKKNHNDKFSPSVPRWLHFYLSKTQNAMKCSLQFGIEISYVMDKILEIKMQ